MKTVHQLCDRCGQPTEVRWVKHHDGGDKITMYHCVLDGWTRPVPYGLSA